MTSSISDIEKIIVRVTDDPDEIKAAQHLRYKVFYEEYAAQPTDDMARERRDFDKYDSFSDHLIVVDNNLPPGPDRIVGTYRLLRQDIAQLNGDFYSVDEYDIGPLVNSGASLLELGRSCVLPDYRTRPVLQKLWTGIVSYLADYNIGLMFGCASLYGTDIEALSEELSYLYHYHLASDNLRPRALESRYIDMNLIPKADLKARQVFNKLPPLIKGYLRLGAMIGDGAVIDNQFNTTDVCIVLPTHLVQSKYMRHYERVNQKVVQIDDGFAQKVSGLARGT